MSMVAVRQAASERCGFQLLDHQPTSARRRRSRSVLLRRRRALLVLIALGVGAVLGAVGSGSAAGWWALAGIVALGGTYLALLRHMRALAAEREFAAILGPSFADFETLGDLAALMGPARFENSGSSLKAEAISPAHSEPTRLRQALAVSHFALASLAGWVLAPVVFVFTLLLGEEPKDATSRRWLEALQVAQEKLRDQSLRAIAVSAATTASVTAVGTVVGVAGAGAASAATPPASAATVAGVSLPNGTGLVKSAGATSYTVVAGDTLSGIAARFGTTVEALAAANHVADPDLIFAGQVIVVPRGGVGLVSGAEVASGGSYNSGSSGGSYTVVAGDTLSGIAARFGTTVEALAAANHVADPDLIFAGQVLRIPGHAGAGAAVGAGAAKPSPSVEAPTAVPASSPSHKQPASTEAASPGEVAAHVALAQVGKPYQWAGAGPASFDCSGLVMYAWAHAGVSLPHYSVAQFDETSRISASELLPGDLVFYDTGDGAQPGHVTIYIGNGQVVTADSPGTYVKVVPLNWDGTPMGFGRVR